MYKFISSRQNPPSIPVKKYGVNIQFVIKDGISELLGKVRYSPYDIIENGVFIK